MRKYLLIISINFLFASTTLVKAQEIPGIINFTKTDYQADDQHWQIDQGCDGNIYIANTAGVLIYNGFKWNLLHLPKNRKVRSIYIGEDCRVYVGAYETIGYIDMDNYTSPRFVQIDSTYLPNSGQEIWNIFGYKNELYFQTFSELFHYKNKKLTNVRPPTNIMFGNYVNGSFYVPEIENGIYRLEDKKFIELELANILPPKTKIAALVEGRNVNEMLVATQYHGLFEYENNILTPVNSTLNDRLKLAQINKMLKLRDGNYVIGTILEGVFFVDKRFKKIYQVNKINGLTDNTVLSLYQDKHEDVWIGCDKGLNLLKLSNNLTYYYDKEGLLGTFFSSIYHHGKLFVGTNQGVFKKGSDNRFELINGSQGQVWSLQSVGDDLLCGHNSGTFLIHEEKVELISDITGGWCMEIIGPDRILQSTYTGFVILKKEHNKWGVETRVENGAIPIEDFIISGQELLGYHNHHGVCRFTFSSDYKKVQESDCADEIKGKPIPPDVNLVKENNKLYFRTADSLWFFDNKNELQINSLPWSESLLEPSSFTYEDIFETPRVIDIGFEENTESRLLGFTEGYVIVPVQNRNEKLTSVISSIYVEHLRGKNSYFDDFTDPLILSSNHSEITIQLGKQLLPAAFEILEYQLIPRNEEWLPLPGNGQLDFYNLNYGNYELIVRDVRFKERLNVLHFEILPHWYETWKGFVLGIFAIFLLVWILNRRSHRLFLKKAKKLEEEKEKEIAAERINSKNKYLEKEIKHKSKMLANSALTLAQKNKMLSDLKDFIRKSYNQENNPKRIQQKLVHLIDRNISGDDEWEIFEQNFAEVHEDFLANIKSKYPDITAGELRLAAYIKMNLTSKEIAPLLNISSRSVENKRYRLRKKMNLDHGLSLSDHMMRL